MLGGNIKLTLKKKTTTKNEWGEQVIEWSDFVTLTGWLDYLSGEMRYTYDTKLQDSTHVFICDYQPINAKPTELRGYCQGHSYDIRLADNPMELNKHLEIVMKLVD